MNMKRLFLDSLIRPSTLSFIREGRQKRGYSLFDWLHGYVYMRWAYLYIGIGTGEHRLARLFRPLFHWIGRLLAFRSNNTGTDESIDGPRVRGDSKRNSRKMTFAETYHGKTIPLREAEQLVTVDREIRLTNLEHVVPYPLACDLILQNPDHIVVLDCPCRVVRPDPCLPLDVCIIVGEPFASFVAEHHPNRSRWINPDEAVEILRAEHERGHVHHAFFKDALLGRFYAICNCCSCCCGAMQAHRHGIPMLASSGYLSSVDRDLCDGCSVCVDYCRFDALSMGEDVVVVEENACMGCGVCVSKCTKGALSLVHDPKGSKPLEIKELVDQTDSKEYEE